MALLQILFEDYLVRLNVLPIGHHVDFPAEVGDSPGKVMVNIILLVWNDKIEKS